MSDYRLTVKVQNNNILKMIEDRGYISARSFCINTGYCYGSLNKLINLREAPIQQNGSMRTTVYALADKLNCHPEELFSSVQMETAIKDNKRTFQVEEAEMKFMMESRSSMKSLEESILDSDREKCVANAVSILTPREQKVINMRFGFDGENVSTLKEVGDRLGVNRERIRQIEAKALRKMRHPSISLQLSEVL